MSIDFQRGQRGTIPGTYGASVAPKVQVLIVIARGQIRSDVDICCLCLGADGRLGDDRYFIFYNQRTSPEGAITQRGSGDEAVFTVDLARLPSSIERLVFTASIDGAEHMSMLGHGEISVGAEGSSERALHQFTGSDFFQEQALLLGEIYRRNGQWRFWAVGQGFAGGLPKLLEHFGADIEGETVRATPSAAIPPYPGRSQAPTSSPVLVASHGDTVLQRLIDQAPAGTMLVLPRNEYEGPGTIDKPLVVHGEGSTIWSRTGPVLRVAHAGVEIHRLGIEATVLGGDGDSDVALDIAPGCTPRLEEVQVRGRVRGLEQEAGEWALPGALALGAVAPRLRNEFRLAVRVPVACRLSSAVSNVRLQPDTLTAGDNNILLFVEGLGAETLIAGEILLHSPHLQRTIALTGSTVGAEGSSPVQGTLLWSPGS